MNVEIFKDRVNENLYSIVTIAKDGGKLHLASYVKGNNKGFNNVLNLYSSSEFKINSFLFREIAEQIINVFGDVDFAIMTSNIFKEWSDRDRYTTNNLPNKLEK